MNNSPQLALVSGAENSNTCSKIVFKSASNLHSCKSAGHTAAGSFLTRFQFLKLPRNCATNHRRRRTPEPSVFGRCARTGLALLIARKRIIAEVDCGGAHTAAAYCSRPAARLTGQFMGTCQERGCRLSAT
ncbi:hypothetical protein J6590_027195 [Homalodisca vitripennis]|nr:hypothetical protein J6590_027195 [Homalodisca vitripennis]